MRTLRHTYRTAYQTLDFPPGLGDYLRSSIGLCQHARERGWRLELGERQAVPPCLPLIWR
jgi:hypothetical protein